MKSWSETIQFKTPLRSAGATSAAVALSPAQLLARDEARENFELGRIAGEKALSEQLLKQRAELHEIFTGVLSSLRQAVPQVVRDTESMMIALAVEVAQKLVANLPISVAMMEAAVRDALTQVEGSEEVTVRLHPADLDLLQKADSQVLNEGEAKNKTEKNFRFLSSPDVTRGGCLVQTRFGTIDARRETKLDLLKQTLLS